MLIELDYDTLNGHSGGHRTLVSGVRINISQVSITNYWSYAILSTLKNPYSPKPLSIELRVVIRKFTINQNIDITYLGPED